MTNGDEPPPPPPADNIGFSKDDFTHMDGLVLIEKNESLVKLSNMSETSNSGLLTGNLELLTPYIIEKAALGPLLATL